MSDYVFCYCMDFGPREFLITVTEDGMIHWDDVNQRRKIRGEADQGLEIRAAFLGDESARARLHHEAREFTVSVELPPKLFERLKRAGKRLDRNRWTTEDEKKLDPVMAEFFWEHVNPFLNPKIERPPTP